MQSRTRNLHRSKPGVESLEGRALLTAGTLDPTFGTGGGYVKTDLGTAGDSATTVAVEPWDGKTLVAANVSTSLTTGYFTLVRYNTDGSLDTTFGKSGIVTTKSSGANDTINAIVFTPDHKIDAVGQVYVSSGKAKGWQIGVARFNANGALDSTFGSTGFVTVAATSSFHYNSSNAAAAVLDPSGRLVIAGSYYGSNSGSIYTPPWYYGNALVRLNANGTFDTSFGSGGIVLGKSAQGTYDAWDIVRLQPLGSSYKIDVVGVDQGKASLLQLDPNGSRDGTFGSNGEVVLAGDGIGGGVAFEPDGGFIGINHAQNDSFTVTRYDASGNIVFDNPVNYSVLLPTGTYPAGFAIQAVAVDPSGRIVLAGGVWDQVFGNFGGTNSAIMRLDSSGKLDTTFGSGGLAVNHFGPYDDELTCLAFQADGSIIAAGYVDDGRVDSNGNLNQQNDLLVTRYKSA
jgi:uncharacterized delta-60 repeat protein